MLLLLAGATTAQTDCVFCPHDVTLDEEIDFENICAETSMPANCVAGWVINSDPDATAKGALGCSVVRGSVTIQAGTTAAGLAQLSGLTHVCGSLTLTSLTNMADFTGLENLAFVKGSVAINNNPWGTTSTPLTSLAGLALSAPEYSRSPPPLSSRSSGEGGKARARESRFCVLGPCVAGKTYTQKN